jgi:glycogen synthase
LNNNPGFKKILMTTDNLGGVWNYSVDLLSELNKNGFEIAIAVMGSALTNEQLNQLRAFDNVIIYHKNYKLEWMENPWEDIDEAGEWLLNIRDEFHPEIVHLNCFSFGALNWGVPVITVAHSDVISWWKSVLNHPYPNRLNEYFKRVKNGLEKSNYVVAPSAAMLEQLNEIYGKFKRQKVIYNGRGCSLIQKAEKQEVIFSMGRIWDTAKNISLVVNAAAMLKWKVKLAGSLQNPNKDEVSVFDKVEFLGNLTSEEVFRHLAEASIFVLPAKYEPFGLSPLEAALSGCALVLGDISSLREIWGDAAIYVNTDDENMLIREVNKLAENKDLLKYYSEKALTKAHTYSLSKMYDEYIELYHSMIDQHHYYLKD